MERRIGIAWYRRTCKCERVGIGDERHFLFECAWIEKEREELRERLGEMEIERDMGTWI